MHCPTLLASFFFTCFLSEFCQGSALHTSVIRIGTEWFAACSVIRNFKVERLPVFSWSQDLIRSQQIEDCDSSNSTSCQDSLQSSFKYSWPAYVTIYIANLFDIEVIPRVASVQFAAAVLKSSFQETRSPRWLGRWAWYLLCLASIDCCAYLFSFMCGPRLYLRSHRKPMWFSLQLGSKAETCQTESHQETQEDDCKAFGGYRFDLVEPRGWKLDGANHQKTRRSNHRYEII